MYIVGAFSDGPPMPPHEQETAEEEASDTQRRETLYRVWMIILAFFSRFHQPKGHLRISTSLRDSVGQGTSHVRSWSRQWIVFLLACRVKPSVTAVRKVMNEAGFGLILVHTLENFYALYTQLHERANHAHLLLGISKGAALFGVYVLLTCQVVATVVLAFKVLYSTTGPLIPSAALSAAALAEAAMFGDISDATTMLGLVCVAVASFLLALFRTDRHHRERSLQLPADSWLLRMEEHARGWCTRFGAGATCPPFCALALYSAASNKFWLARPLLYDFVRARHQLGLATASLLALLSAQDSDGHRRLARGAECAWERTCCVLERATGRRRAVERGFGDKKHL